MVENGETPGSSGQCQPRRNLGQAEILQVTYDSDDNEIKAARTDVWEFCQRRSPLPEHRGFISCNSMLHLQVNSNLHNEMTEMILDPVTTIVVFK